jgi:WD40 repeat protein
MLARALVAAVLLADITGSASRLNPATARFGRPVSLPADDWSNWDLSFDGSTLGATKGDERVLFYDTLTGREIATIETDGHSIHDTAISGDGRHYALTLDNGTVQIYSAAEKKKVGEFKVSSGFC